MQSNRSTTAGYTLQLLDLRADRFVLAHTENVKYCFIFSALALLETPSSNAFKISYHQF